MFIREADRLDDRLADRLDDRLDDREVQNRIVEERNLEIKQLERDISDIAEIMSDMSTLVESQSEQINLAVENIEHAEGEIVEATKNLENASNHQTSLRKWIIGAGVASVGLTLSGGVIAIVSLPFGLATIGFGVLGAVLTTATATTLR